MLTFKHRFLHIGKHRLLPCFHHPKMCFLCSGSASIYVKLLTLCIKKKINFQAVSFDGLNGIVKEIVDGSCVEITSAHPQALVCSNCEY